MKFLCLFVVVVVLTDALNGRRFVIVKNCGEEKIVFATRSRLECSVLIARRATELGFRWDQKSGFCIAYQRDDGRNSRKCWQSLPVRFSPHNRVCHLSKRLFERSFYNLPLSNLINLPARNLRPSLESSTLRLIATTLWIDFRLVSQILWGDQRATSHPLFQHELKVIRLVQAVFVCDF